MPWRETLCPRLTPQLAAAVRALTRGEADDLREIRVRVGEQTELVLGDASRRVGEKTGTAQMEALLAALSGYARYACERQMAQGFIPLPGGHRAGVCGRLVSEDGKPVRMSAVTSVCVRIARHVPGASVGFRRALTDGAGRPRRVLLLGPPGCGKTTALRDAALYLAGARGLHVAVADEREELFAGQEGAAGVDVLSGAPKADALPLLLRSMGPQVLATDEVGDARDVDALLNAARCGCGLIATAHASGLQDALRRPALRALFEARAFERCVLLGAQARVRGVLDEDGKPAPEETEGKEESEWQTGTPP